MATVAGIKLVRVKPKMARLCLSRALTPAADKELSKSGKLTNTPSEYDPLGGA